VGVTMRVAHCAICAANEAKEFKSETPTP